MPKNYRYYLLITILACLVFIIYPWGVLPVKNLTAKITYPLANGFTGLADSLVRFFDNIKMINKLLEENKNLKNENENLQTKLDELKEVNHENEILKEELGFIKENKEEGIIPAQIIGRSPTGFSQNLKINKGRKDGVKKGETVVSHGYLIGTVSEVTENFCEVFLITNANSLIPVILQESRGTGLLKGGLRGLMMQEIPLDNKTKVGEVILTSGLGGDLPAGVPVGSVEKIISQESEIFQEVSVNSPINFSKIELVFILNR